MIETHGTGTLLGDPIECNALSDVFAARAEGRVCWLGTVKSNIGHLEGAAGIAGFIKACLSIRTGNIFPSIHFAEPNPYLKLDHGRLAVAVANLPFDAAPDGHRVAIVNSFGLGGANASALLSDVAYAEASVPSLPHAVPIFARREEDLAEIAGQILQRIRENPNEVAAGAIFQAQVRRHLPYRSLVLGKDHNDLVAQLESLAQEPFQPGRARAPRHPPKICFAFSGQGSQRAGMGQKLYDAFPVFREAADACLVLFAEAGREDGTDLFRSAATEEQVRETRNAQPLIFVYQYALCRLLGHWGFWPDAVVGHSVGEFAAAVSAGFIGLREAVAVLCSRSHFMDRYAPRGVMASAFDSADAIRGVIENAGLAEQVFIAANNAADLVTISARDEDAYRGFLLALGTQVRVKRLNVECAFHTPLPAGAFEELGEADVPGAGASAGPKNIAFFSTLTGQRLDPESLPLDYWRRQMQEPVDFLGAVRAAVSTGPTVWVEIGAEPALQPLLRRILAEDQRHGIAGASIDRGPLDELDRFSAVADHLFALEPPGSLGGPLAGALEAAQDGAMRSPYPFQRRSYWLPRLRADGRYHVPGTDSLAAALDTGAPVAAGQPADAKTSPNAPAATKRLQPGAIWEVVRGHVAKVCGREPEEVLPGHDFWNDLTFDSMMFVDLKLRLERTLRPARKVPFEAYAKLRTAGELSTLVEQTLAETEEVS